MTKEQIIARKDMILCFIYNTKITVIRHIEKMFFSSYHSARNYLLNLQKQGYLKGTKLPGHTAEKIYFLSYKGIKELQKQVDNIKRQKINFRDAVHDILVTDIMIWMIKNYKVSYQTDFMLRRARGENETVHRIPDYIFVTPKGNHGLVEYQQSDKSKETIIKYINDYKSYYPAHTVYFVVRPGRVKYYQKLLSEYGENYYLCTYDEEWGLQIHHKG